jgi:hypothetical protein
MPNFGVVQNQPFVGYRGARKPRAARAGFRFERLPVREAASLPASNSPGLQWPEAQQRKPMRMALAGHQFPRAFAVAVGKPAAHEASMVQEELKQAHAHQRIPAMRCIRWVNEGSGQDSVLPQVIDVFSLSQRPRIPTVHFPRRKRA